MRVAVTSTVIFEVPEAPLEDVRERFYLANVIAVGHRMHTLTGQDYVMRAIESLEVERRPA